MKFYDIDGTELAIEEVEEFFDNIDYTKDYILKTGSEGAKSTLNYFNSLLEEVCIEK